MTKEKTMSEKKDRVLAIDRFRGIAILLVVISAFAGALFDSAMTVLDNAGQEIPAFLEVLSKIFSHQVRDGLVIIPNFGSHGVGDNRAGLALADVFAPLFMFIIGLTYVASFKSREEKYGTKQAYLQVASRFLSLIAIGATLNGINHALEYFTGRPITNFKLGQLIELWMVIPTLAVTLFALVSKFIKHDKVKLVAKYAFRGVLALVATTILIISTIHFVEYVSGISTTTFGGANWDILQHIGFAGLLALPFVKSGNTGKLLFVALSFTFFIIFSHFGNPKLITEVTEGGFFGAVGASTLILLGSVFESLKNNKKHYFTLTGVLAILFLVFTLGVNLLFTKRGYTPNYVMLSGVVGSLIYFVLSLFNNYKPKFSPLAWWGRTAIVSYLSSWLVGLVLNSVLIMSEIAVAGWLIVLITVAVVALYTLVYWALARKNKVVKI